MSNLVRKCSNPDCERYGQELDIDEFYEDKTHKTAMDEIGHRYRCKECHKRQMRELIDTDEQKERKRIYARKYYLNR
jgi:hypothetical protein